MNTDQRKHPVDSFMERLLKLIKKRKYHEDSNLESAEVIELAGDEWDIKDVKRDPITLLIKDCTFVYPEPEDGSKRFFKITLAKLLDGEVREEWSTPIEAMRVFKYGWRFKDRLLHKRFGIFKEQYASFGSGKNRFIWNSGGIRVGEKSYPLESIVFGCTVTKHPLMEKHWLDIGEKKKRELGLPT